jgi:glyoxylase-like metal-dependent hydrolase (beta-lactamase superfamily II)
VSHSKRSGPRLQPVVPGLWLLRLGIANAYVVDDGGLTLIDTGMAGGAGTVLEALRGIGHGPEDLVRIVVTHAHPDHSGSLAALKRASRAEAWMHGLDAALIRRGVAARPFTPSPGLLPWLAARLFMRAERPEIEPHEIEHELQDGSLVSGTTLTAIHAPGHSAGHVALWWPRHGGVLFAGDAAANMAGLGRSLVYEDHALGLATLARLAALDFEIAVFGHGKPIMKKAAVAFRSRWARS